MEKIEIEDFDYCKSCELVDMYNDLLETNEQLKKRKEIIKCPKYIIALLKDISNKLDSVMTNMCQEIFFNPFNTDKGGEKFSNGTFEVYAFDYGKEQKYNFKYKDIEISWYKSLGRVTCINKEVNPEDAVKMYNDCMKSLEMMAILEEYK